MIKAGLFLLIVGVTGFFPLDCRAESTQTILAKYREDVEQTCVNNAKPADLKVRDTILLQLKAKFTKDIQAGGAPDGTIAQHFSALLDNITAANNGFMFKDGEKFRQLFIVDAVTAFLKEVKSSNDLGAKRTPNGWFETFAGMLQEIRNRLALRKGLGNAVASKLSPVFLQVYRASAQDTKSDAAEDYKAQLATVKRLFPVNKPDFKERNGAIATLLEGHASAVFKERTK